MDIIVGVVLLLVGLAVGFAGLRLWFILLPILGFVAGLSAGVALMHWIFNEGLFSTGLGLIIGFFLGLIFALLSYLYWYFGVLFGAGYVGAELGSGLMHAVNIDSNFLIAIAAILGAIALVVIAIILLLPLIMVIVMSAMAGAAWVVAGFMLIFGAIDRADLGFGAVAAAINDHWFWFLAWFILAVIGITFQLRLFGSIELPDDRWTNAGTGGLQPA
jgi:hypothetical protein